MKDFAELLELRRYFLTKYHGETPVSVLESAKSGGHVWAVLRCEYAVTDVWTIDPESKPGAVGPGVKLASLLALGGWIQNVIDLNAGGAPWVEWDCLLRNVTRPTTVFLTIGQAVADTVPVVAVTLGLGKLNVPRPILKRLGPHAISAQLARPLDYPLRVVECAEVPAKRRLVGFHLVPN